jgi:hypothetical protein
MATAKTEDVSVDALTKELVALRSRQGITHERVSKQILLVSLPIVKTEMERLAIDDRPAAAYNVIECAVLRGIGRSDFRTILAHTLNIGGVGADTLTSRQDHIREILAIGETGYEERERTAYRELASLLLRRTVTPCDGVETVPLELNVELVPTPALDTVAEMLSSVLRSLMTEVADDFRRQLSETMLGTIPGVRSYLPADLDPVEQVTMVLTQSFEIMWKTFEDEEIDPYRARIVTPAITIELGYSAVHRVLDTLKIDEPLTRHIASKTPDREQWEPQYYVWLHRVVSEIADALVSIERQQLWPPIFGQMRADVAEDAY